MAWHIYSTLTSANQYVTWAPTSPDQLPKALKRITIAGGANVANKHLVTPRGVVTTVTDEDYAHLVANPHFQEHLKNKFIYCDQIKANANKVADQNLEPKDDSAPKTPNDFKKKKGDKGQTKGLTVREDSKGNYK